MFRIITEGITKLQALWNNVYRSETNNNSVKQPLPESALCTRSQRNFQITKTRNNCFSDTTHTYSSSNSSSTTSESFTHDFNDVTANYVDVSNIYAMQDLLSSQICHKSVSIDDFRLIKVLGKGNFGKVILAQHHEDGDLLAIKILKKSAIENDSDAKAVMMERKMLFLGTQHPFLTALHSCFQSKDCLYLVMEFASSGDLMTYLHDVKILNEECACFCSAEITLALFFLHRLGIIVRDVKPENILIDAEGHFKLTDFGMCKENMWFDKTTSTFCGTPNYMAPEIVLECEYGFAVDWWSLGVLIYEMLTGKLAFDGDDVDDIYSAVVNNEVKYLVSLSEESQDIISKYLVKNPFERLGCDDESEESILFMPFYRFIDWLSLEAKKVPSPLKEKLSLSQNKDRMVDCAGDNDQLCVIHSVIDQEFKQVDDGKSDLFSNFSFVNIEAFKRRASLGKF